MYLLGQLYMLHNSFQDADIDRFVRLPISSNVLVLVLLGVTSSVSIYFNYMRLRKKILFLTLLKWVFLCK